MKKEVKAKIKELQDFEVNIMGQVWQVVFKDELITDAGDRAYGICFPNELVIALDRTFPTTTIIQTLIHEMSHALISRLYLRPSIANLACEEILVDTFASMMAENFEFNL